MAIVRITRILDRDEAITRLVRLRQEWQEATDGQPLAEVNGSVGLLLADVVTALGLTSEEVAQVLGTEAYTEPEQMVIPEVVGP